MITEEEQKLLAEESIHLLFDSTYVHVCVCNYYVNT